jgi:methionyl-tRNA formyltransferase
VLEVFVAGGERAPLTDAIVTALRRNPRIHIVDVARSRVRAVPECDLLITGGHRHWLGEKVRSTPRIGAVGIHPSLLPKYRGTYPLWWALRRGEREVGLTLYVLDSGIDSGPIIAQERIPVARFDSFGTLYARVCARVSPLLDDFVERVDLERSLPPSFDQDDSECSVYPAPHFIALHGWRAKRKVARTVLGRFERLRRVVQ